MLFNPFEKEFNQVQKKFNKLKSNIESLEKEIDEYYQIDIDECYSKKEYLEAEIKSRKKEKEEIDDVTFWDAAVLGIGALRKGLKHRSLYHIINNAEQELIQTQESISKFESTKIDHLKQEVDKITEKLSLSKEELEEIESRKLKVDEAISDIVIEIKSIKSKIKKLENDIVKAEKIKDELSNASNPYERAMAHKQCEELFNDGTPGRVISKKRTKEKSLKRTLKKLQEKARDEGLRASKIIKKIIVDGNNLCYENDKFVGIKPLLALAPILKEDFEVIVFFDSQISSMLDMNKAQIKKIFGKCVDVYVMPASQSADETLLTLASSEDTTFVLSNDVFRDFTDKDVVSNQRIIKHTILDGRVIINSLNINTVYA